MIVETARLVCEPLSCHVVGHLLYGYDLQVDYGCFRIPIATISGHSWTVDLLKNGSCSWAALLPAFMVSHHTQSR